MKSSVLLLSLFLLPSLSFGGSHGLSHILEDEMVIELLEDVSSFTVDFKSENIATTWNYTAEFRYTKGAVSLNGTKLEVPCVLNANYSTIGGFAGTEITPVVAEESCLNPH